MGTAEPLWDDAELLRPSRFGAGADIFVSFCVGLLEEHRPETIKHMLALEI